MGTREEVIAEATSIAIPITKATEGLRLKVYKCPAGVWTQGYGTVNKPDGSKVSQYDQPISIAVAEEWLYHELRNTYIKGVLALSPNLIKYKYILAALGDWAYNCGVTRYRASTLRRKVRDESWEEVITELSKWVRGGGRKLPGLVKRRKLEAALIRKQIALLGE